MADLCAILVPVFAAGCIFLLSRMCLSLAGEMTYVTLADGRRQARRLPLVFKLLLPFAGNLRGVAGSQFFSAARGKAARRLVSAGFEGLVADWEFIALGILTPLVMGTLFFALAALFSVADPAIGEHLPFLAVLGYALFALHPGMWLRSEIKARRRAILRAMPFVIDLLTLSVEAGVDFINALQRTVSSRAADALAEELIRVDHEIRLGASRRTALKNLADRVDIPDMRSFAFSLIQADELGVSIGAILRIQSGQIRQKRFDRAERLANEAPVKMLFPLMLFIFPAVFIVLLAPILSRVAGGVL